METAVRLSNYYCFPQYVNRAFLELSGYTNEEVIGQPAWDILKPFDTKMVGEWGWKRADHHVTPFVFSPPG